MWKIISCFALRNFVFRFLLLLLFSSIPVSLLLLVSLFIHRLFFMSRVARVDILSPDPQGNQFQISLFTCVRIKY